jgi:hypothetical protein
VALATLFGICSVSCREDPTGSNGIVRVGVEDQAFRLFNQTDAPVGYFAIMTEVLPFTDFVLCAHPSPQCLRLPANGSALVSFKDVCCNYDGKKEVSFFIWTVVRHDDGTFELSMLPGIRFTP